MVYLTPFKLLASDFFQKWMNWYVSGMIYELQKQAEVVAQLQLNNCLWHWLFSEHDHAGTALYNQ